MVLPDDKHRLSFPGLDGLYGYVTVDGQPLEVYGAKVEGKKAVGYIEAQDDKEFKVHFVDSRPQLPESGPRLFAIRVNVDGQYATGHYAKEQFKPGRVFNYVGRRITPTTRQPFKFGTLQTTDDNDLACNDENVIKELGTIRVGYHRLYKRRMRPSSTTFSAAAVPVVHEQAKKATLSHAAAYGPAVTVRAHSGRLEEPETMDDDDSPFSALHFRYRSRALLRLDGLLPDVSPPPDSRDADQGPEPGADSPDSHGDQALPPATLHAPNAGPSNPRRSASSADLVADDSAALPKPDHKLPKVEAGLDDDQREERIAALQRQIDQLRNGAAGSTQKRGVGASTSPQSKRIKLEEVEKVEQEKKENRRKGKKPEVIDLCDSD